jgi:catechol 2,3-dioxygenase-like lactoylglutathione lyase family enzyme
MSAVRLDHVVLAVRDLNAAVRDYRALGFIVMPGGVHPGGWTHNALIVLADGSYLELLAPTDARFLEDPEALAAPNFLFALAGGDGAIGLALAADDLGAAVAAMQARGANIASPRVGGRTRPDGVQLEWRTAMPGRSVLPFFIEDVTPREWRVPTMPESTAHANGAVGIRAVSVAALDPAAMRAHFTQLLGDAGAGGAWPLGQAELRIVTAPGQHRPTLALELCANEAEPAFLDPMLTHGAQIGVRT